ncbi:MAG: DUF4097 family beta strand repeat protein [Opitutae bacterium]|nr:DUF4097 family beta strand repeat protein [Opitutae bacterium]
MKKLLSLLALGALLAAPAALSAKIIRTVEKTFTVQPGGNLKALTQGGDIVVQTADINEVRITARETIRAGTEQEADDMLKKLTLTLEQHGNDVTAEAKYAERPFGFHFGSWPPVQVDFTVTLPKRFNADLETSPADKQGRVSAGLIKASINLDLHTSGGDITVGDLNGNVRARTSGGDLKFARIDGELDGGTSGGNITLREGTARAKLSSSGGDIEVERAGGPTEVTTSGGNIRLDSVENLVSAHTAGGDVIATITGPIKQDTVIGTSGGEVEVHVVKSAAFNLDASTSGGDVDASGLTLTIDRGGVGKSRLVGSVNGGGPRLKLRSSGGDIKLRAD